MRGRSSPAGARRDPGEARSSQKNLPGTDGFRHQPFGDGSSTHPDAPTRPNGRAKWLTATIQFAWFPVVAIFLPLLFPHGRPPSPRWWPVLWLGVAGLVFDGVGAAIAPGRLELSDANVVNPLGVPGPLPEILSALGSITGILAMALAALALAVRFRRARGIERQQIKWFASVGILGLVLLAFAVFVNLVTGDEAPALVDAIVVGAWLTGFILLALGLPAATAIAILRHRLYDIDVVIRRTLVYGALTATLGATYLGLVLLIGLAVGQSDLAIAASTLAVAALFRPARGRIQSTVDQRFYRRRYNATRTLEAFGGRLRDEIDLEALGADLRGVVRETVQPAHVSLWLRSGP